MEQADGEGGAVVQGVVLYVNGAARRDLRPTVVRHRAGVGPQVGSVSAATGRFRGVDYRLFSGNRLYYRGRNDVLSLFVRGLIGFTEFGQPI